MVAHSPVWWRSNLVSDDWTLFWSETVTLLSGLGTDVHFSGDETGLQWEDYLFEMQKRRGVANGDVERSKTSDLRCTL